MGSPSTLLCSSFLLGQGAPSSAPLTPSVGTLHIRTGVSKYVDCTKNAFKNDNEHYRAGIKLTDSSTSRPVFDLTEWPQANDKPAPLSLSFLVYTVGVTTVRPSYSDVSMGSSKEEL